ncbi:hypothetical protein V1512DRAFT_258395 [Lipomyces arxii]|uniref:uncharacterized protein n=1 Tax=Lipomyces arxii TaxID=56418 RepID=UPI0034CDF85F
MLGLSQSAPFLTLVASVLSVAASFAIPYSRYLFSASFSWVAFCLATFLPLDRFLIASSSAPKYRRIDVLICSCCIVLSTVCASLLGERGNGLASVLIPLLVHVLRFEYMTQPAVAAVAAIETAKVDMSTLGFITFTSFVALLPNYPGASQLVFGICSSVFAATYLSISDISIPLTRAVLREISAYTCVGLLVMSALLDGPSGWRALGTVDGLAIVMILWSLVSAVKNLIIMVLIQQLSPLNASFVDLIGVLSTTLYSHATWKVTAMCVSYMAIATTLLPKSIGEVRVRYLSIKVSKLITLVIALFLFIFGLVIMVTPRVIGSSHRVMLSSVGGKDTWNTTIHPISFLIDSHLKQFNSLLERQTSTYPEAVKEYRRRYGIYPPPNFDKWYAYATELKSPIFDDYDSILAGLRPFFGLDPSVIRANVREALANPDSNLLGLQIRGGDIYDVKGGNGNWYESTIVDMITPFVHFLPDMDLAFNMMDQPRVVLPYADVSALTADPIKSGRKNDFSLTPKEDLKAVDAETTLVIETFARQSPWAHAKLSCAPDSPARTRGDDRVNRYAMSIGFIKNSTAGADLCLSPSYHHHHGALQRPERFSIITDPVPIFSQSKLSSFADILFPSPSYFADRAPYDPRLDRKWAEKRETLFWRGVAAGLHSSHGGWKNGHRQRAVDYFTNWEDNCTLLMDREDMHTLSNNLYVASQQMQVDAVHEDIVHRKRELNMSDIVVDLAPLPAADVKANEKQTLQLAEQTSLVTNSGFAEKSVLKSSFKQYIDLKFSDYRQCDLADCKAEHAYFGDVAPVSSFQDTWNYKYLLDLDGNTFSTRFYAFLKSKSMVVKQSLFREWHDERIHPWVHYVPLSMSLKEGFETLRFLVENDAAAKYIARQSRSWAAKAIRKEDMQVYFFRVLLEYGRMIDENRDEIGCS